MTKKAEWPRRLRSQEWYGGTSRDVIYHRGWMKNQGYPHDLFDGRPVIGICAAGILIRAVAAQLSDKQNEPPLIAVAADGSSVVPLLGGHHGANLLSRRIATVLQAFPPSPRPAISLSG